jgi:hypothetical protein
MVKPSSLRRASASTQAIDSAGGSSALRSESDGVTGTMRACKLISSIGIGPSGSGRKQQRCPCWALSLLQGRPS